MKNRRYVISISILIAALLAAYFFLVKSTTVYIVRHAERSLTNFNNPPLTAAGEQRAIALANLLKSKNIKFIYSTDSLRTRSTAKPLADTLGLPITIYLKDITPVQYSNLPLGNKQNILIVGHSETILNLFRDLRGTTNLSSIPGNDFDNLFKVTVFKILWFKWRSSEVTTYGAPSP